MYLEGSHGVYGDKGPIGQCEFVPQGLYWKINCTIREGWEGVSRLVLFSATGPVSLGIPAPDGSVLTLERRLPRKSIPGEGDFSLELLPLDAPLRSRREQAAEAPPPVPVPEEPTTEELPEPIPEEPPIEELPEPILEEPPIEELPEPIPEEPPIEELPEPIPEEPPIEELPEPIPEEPPMEKAPPEPIFIRPGDKLPPLENWERFRVTPQGNGSFLLHQEPS